MKKKRYKPFYKNFLKLRENIQNRPKVFKFKKKKWSQFQFFAKKKLKFFKRYKIKDQFKLVVSRFRYHSQKNSFKKRFKNIMLERKLFSFFYGILKKKYLKTHLKQSFSKNLKNISNFNTYKHNALKFFESRLDTVLHRSKFSFSIKNADQLILHGHILVNGKVIRTKSYILKTNDLVEVTPSVKSRALIKKNIDRSNFWPIPQKYLIVNYNTLQILFILNENNILPLFDHYLNVNSLFLNIKK